MGGGWWWHSLDTWTPDTVRYTVDNVLYSLHLSGLSMSSHDHPTIITLVWSTCIKLNVGFVTMCISAHFCTECLSRCLSAYEVLSPKCCSDAYLLSHGQDTGLRPY